MKEKSLVIALICTTLIALVCVLSLAKAGPGGSSLANIPEYPMEAGAFGVPTVAGKGFEERKYPADLFLVHGTLSFSGKNKLVVDSLEKMRTELIKTLNSRSVAKIRVDWDKLDLRETFEYNEYRKTASGYAASQTFTASVPYSIDDKGIVIMLMKRDSVEVNGIELKMEKSDKIRSEVLAAAGEKALQDARMTAQAIGGKTGRVLYVKASDNSSRVSTNMSIADMLGGLIGGGTGNTAGNEQRAAYKSRDLTFSDSLTVNANIEVVVELK